MTFSKLLLALCFALQFASAQIQSITPAFSGLSDYKGQYVVMLFVPDLKKTCIHDILPYSAAYNDFKNIGTQVLIISSDGAATEEDIQIPIIGNSNIAKEYGLEGVNAILVTDTEHRLRDIQINDVGYTRNVLQTFRLILALKYSDKNAVAIPSSWQTIENTDIPKHSIKKNDFYKTIKDKPIPIIDSGVGEEQVDEIWTGPAQYGGKIDKKQDLEQFEWIAFRQKCFKYDGTIYKDEWNYEQVFTVINISYQYQKKINSCISKAIRDVELFQTVRVSCPPDRQRPEDLEEYQLHGIMSYCEFKMEKKSFRFLAEEEPPRGEWLGNFLVARLTGPSTDQFDGSVEGIDGEIIQAHIHITDVNNWDDVIYSTFQEEDPEIFQIGERTPECLNKAFRIFMQSQKFIVYCPAEQISGGRGWRYLPPGRPLRITFVHMVDR